MRRATAQGDLFARVETKTLFFIFAKSEKGKEAKIDTLSAKFRFAKISVTFRKKFSRK
jgi:hypothetical protein